MESFLARAEQAFADYREELKAAEQKLKPADGLFGFGHSLKDDACHVRADDRVRQAVEGLCAMQPPSDVAEKMVRKLLFRDDVASWPQAAQWMLRAMERHALPLIPFLSRETAKIISLEYAGRYKRWERMPVQKQVCRALDQQSK